MSKKFTHNCINCQHLSLDHVKYAKFKLVPNSSSKINIHSTCNKNVFRQNSHHIALLIDTQRHAADYIKNCLYYAPMPHQEK